MNKQELRQIISEHIKKHGSIGQIEGMIPYCIIYAESEEVGPEGLGYITKFYGISYPWKGRIDNDLIDVSIEGKRILVEWLRFFLKIWYLAPFILLHRKDLLNSIHRIFRGAMFLKAKKKMRYADFSPCCGELLKCGLKQAEGRIEQSLLFWAVYFIEWDNFYRLVLQDFCGIINIRNLKVCNLLELWRVINETIKREKTARGGVSDKLKIALVALKFLVLIPKYRKKIVNFLLELDMSKVKMDEAEWYWGLRYDTYNFGGRTYNERFAEAIRTDKEKGNYIICDHPEEEKKETGSHFSDNPIIDKRSAIL